MRNVNELGLSPKEFDATDKYHRVDETIILKLKNSIDSTTEINNCIETIILLQVESKSIFKSKDVDLRNSDSNKYNKIGNRYTIIDLQTLNYFSNNPTGLIYLTTQVNNEYRTYLTLRTEKDKTIIDNNGNELDIPMEINHIDGNHLNNNLINLQTVTQDCHRDIHRAEYLNSIRGE